MDRKNDTQEASDVKSAQEKYEELVRDGLVKSPNEAPDRFEAPSSFIDVPNITSYQS